MAVFREKNMKNLFKKFQRRGISDHESRSFRIQGI